MEGICSNNAADFQRFEPKIYTEIYQRILLHGDYGFFGHQGKMTGIREVTGLIARGIVEKLNGREYDFISEKKEWRLFCKKEERVPLYFKDWYWDINCEDADDWWVIVVHDEKTDEIIAAFPFMYRKIHGMFRIENPWQVARAGIWIRPLDGVSMQKEMEIYKTVTEAVVERLPECDLFYVDFDSNFANWSPLLWKGFRASPNYTYTIDKRDGETLKSTVSKRCRQKINTGSKKYDIRVNETGIDEYWDFFEETYEWKDKKINFTKERFTRLISGLKAHDAVQIRSAHESGRIVAAQITFLDNDRMYYHFCTQLDSMDAQSALTYFSIKYAMETGRKFDFEGSMIKGPAEFAFTFQPDTEICYQVRKESRKYRIVNGIRDTWGAVVRR